MQSYIKEAIETFGEDVSIVVTSPAKSRLFDVTEGSEKFQKKKPQLSLNSGKAVVDNEEVTTRYWNCHIFSLRSSEIPRYTWLGKTETIYQILSQNIGYDRVIGADNLYEVLTYLDTSYATHDSVKIFVFNFWLDDFSWINPQPNFMQPPVQPFISSCVAYDVSK